MILQLIGTALLKGGRLTFVRFSAFSELGVAERWSLLPKWDPNSSSDPNEATEGEDRFSKSLTVERFLFSGRESGDILSGVGSFVDDRMYPSTGKPDSGDPSYASSSSGSGEFSNSFSNP